MCLDSQPGRELVAAGYCMYGSSCSMVISVGSEPSHFLLDPSLGEFVLITPKMTVPDAGKIYAINEGNSSLWDAPVSQCAPLFCAEQRMS
jgi:fructose-1,6-bisphosphatase I